MRFERITLKNFMQYRDTEIPLSRKPGRNDLHIFVGGGGTGKTNLFRAIRWCLYGDKPHHPSPRQSPILNIKAAEASDDMKDRKVAVEIVAREGDQIFLFSRKAMFKVYRYAGYFNSVSTEQTGFYWNVLAVMRQQKKLTGERIRQEVGPRLEELLGLIMNRNLLADIDEDCFASKPNEIGYSNSPLLSSGERRLLTLSSKLAACQLSAFNVPIVMDAPLAWMSDGVMESFADMILAVSRVRQVILLLSTLEYSHEVSEHLDRSCSSRFALKPGKDGRETDVETC